MKNTIGLRRTYPVLAVLSAIWAVVLYLPTWSIAATEGISCTPEPTDMIIQHGDLVNCRVNVVGDIDVFRFSGSVGETVKVQTSKLSGAGSPTFEVHRPDGSRLLCNAFGDCPLDQTGSHSILVSELGNNQTVEYALAFERIAPPSGGARPIQYSQAISDEIKSVGDIDLFFFDGEAGDTVKVLTSKLSGSGSPTFEVHRPDGSRLFCNAFGDCPLDQTGRHSILVSELGNNQTVEYMLTLECLSGACVSPVVPDVAGCIRLNDGPLVNIAVLLKQKKEPDQTVHTDANGCYEFESAAPGKSFDVIIKGPVVP